MTVNTAKAEGRRTVRYESLDDLMADAKQLANGNARMLGNWTLGQMLGHIANALNGSIDGFPGKLSWPIRIVAKLFMKKMLLQGPLRPGFKLPKDAEAKMVPAKMSVEEGLAKLAAAIERQKKETKRVPHLALGNLTVDQWAQAHLRHAELHMSFAIPADA